MKLQTIFLLLISCLFMLASCTSSGTVGEVTTDQAVVSPDPAPTSADVVIEENPMPASIENTLVPNSETTGNDFFPNFERATFSFENADSVRPENVVQEFNYLPVPGGSGPQRCKEPATPEVCDAPETVDWPSHFCIHTQGWKNNENVTITINFPNGDQAEEVGEAHILQLNESDNSPSVIYCSMVQFSEMQVGEYKVIFEGKSGRVEENVLVQIPLEPQVHMVGDKETGAFAILTGFQPQESVQLLAYESNLSDPAKASFVAWSEYKTDSNGGLLIEVPSFPENGFYSYCVLGESSRVPKSDIILQ